ncbi:HTH-type transcriptional regulator MgrA [Streptococcus infantarius subsp. infantarius]|nr:HTH-type transcriptional regulator MgrA [Streptococcus infantarius subsp. infantarius]MCO4529300.1 HTH-type transcriptional regulator MgrA [Streptococcus infantarius subsp. infantarius]MCO4649220.1 HTH-type transcriptional regulator MgrA [Streptococcus infantarius subsp. infantarius]MCO4665950.1 HTH-type transcriptional regulator MgrA [Streptococcus infantarius subsp. infantarius]MCO4668923.1 HTH-type transcriptional regulator MgrA [Streptococcus infantarius subsp. infantarius]
MPEQHPTLTNQLCFAIYNANRVFNQFYKQKLAKFDLTYTQYIVLLAL